jgi:hypothetical protein
MNALLPFEDWVAQQGPHPDCAKLNAGDRDCIEQHLPKFAWCANCLNYERLVVEYNRLEKEYERTQIN